MHTPHISLVIALFSFALADGASSQSLYVSDKLVLNVYSEANQGGGRVATIETGDAVEELERVDNFVRVRLSDGREGWVGANYLSTVPPAILQLKQLQSMPAAAAAPSKQSADDLVRLQKQNTALSAEIAELKKKATSPAIVTPPAAEVSTMTNVETVVKPEQPAALAPRVVVQRNLWWAWALAVIAAGTGGFVAGYQTLGRRVRQRFGGVKVY
jgi:uncharacterized protein YgiM (DUF1202 family)